LPPALAGGEWDAIQKKLNENLFLKPCISNVARGFNRGKYYVKQTSQWLKPLAMLLIAHIF